MEETLVGEDLDLRELLDVLQDAVQLELARRRGHLLEGARQREGKADDDEQGGAGGGLAPEPGESIDTVNRPPGDQETERRIGGKDVPGKLRGREREGGEDK